MLKIGSEAYTASLAFYSALKTAIAAGEVGLKSVYDDLSARFPGRPTTKLPNAQTKVLPAIISDPEPQKKESPAVLKIR